MKLLLKKSKCVCGDVSGGVMCIGYFFGRTTGGDSKVQNTLKLANELQESCTNYSQRTRSYKY